VGIFSIKRFLEGNFFLTKQQLIAMIWQWIFRPPKKIQDLQTPPKNSEFSMGVFFQVSKGEKFQKKVHI